MNLTEQPQLPRTQPAGMTAFVIVWGGQLVSLLGTGMSQFALTIWAWELTGQATALALVAFFNFAPTVALSPVAGALVDRWNRKLTMMLSDLLAGAATIGILLLFLAGRLEIWHLYLAGIFTGVGQAFQWPAYSAAISTMLPKEQYGRANGMLSMAEAASGIAAPLLAGILLVPLGIAGILTIDIVTFLLAIGALLLVFVPQPKATEAGAQARGGLLKESVYGFRYIFERPSLLGLQLVFFFINFTSSMGIGLLAPMILARSGNNELALASVQSAFGVGGLVGGLAMSLWGGPRRRVHGVLLGMAGASLLGEMVLGLGQGTTVWMLAAFATLFFIPIINGSNQAIWQAKVAPDVQGRVFAARRLIAQLTGPVAILISGPLADFVFEPAMAPGGALANTFGGLVGTGPGAGMALIFVINGLIGVVISFAGYAFQVVRNAEDLLPDHDAVPQPAPADA